MTSTRVNIYKVIAASLRAGVLLSVTLCVLGLLLWTLADFPAPDVISGTNIPLLSSLTVRGDFAGVVYLAVVVLIATPILRVVVSAVGFSMERDRQFMIISLAVLAMLLFAIFSGAVI